MRLKVERHDEWVFRVGWGRFPMAYRLYLGFWNVAWWRKS
jgi:hypothetical protein